jgi:hypothetical protein
VRNIGLLPATILALALSGTAAMAQQALPPAGGSGTEVTIFKVPQRSYLTQGPITKPGTNSDFEANVAYQSSMPGTGIAGFSNYPLPGPFELPGAYRY